MFLLEFGLRSDPFSGYLSPLLPAAVVLFSNINTNLIVTVKNVFDAESSTIQKQMAIAMATNEELAKQKESLEKKASRMAQSLAGMLDGEADDVSEHES